MAQLRGQGVMMTRGALGLPVVVSGGPSSLDEWVARTYPAQKHIEGDGAATLV